MSPITDEVPYVGDPKAISEEWRFIRRCPICEHTAGILTMIPTNIRKNKSLWWPQKHECRHDRPPETIPEGQCVDSQCNGTTIEGWLPQGYLPIHQDTYL